MTMPFYVSPEQLMKDRADYARKGIGRGRSVAVLQYVDGILFVSENPSQALHKISEIYDRIGFAAVGRYNEFENLRIAGVRLADLRGYSYDRRDVTGRGLANAYAQTLGSIFSSGGEKPYEVELFVAELGESTATDQVFRLTYDGQVADERGFAAMGGQADSVTSFLAERWTEGLSLTDALRLAVAALGHGETGADRTIPPADLEVAVLDRTRTQQRKFRRIGDALLQGMLDGPPPGSPTAPPPDDGDDSDGGVVGCGDTDTHAGEPTDEPTSTDVSNQTPVVPVMPLVDGEVPPEEQPTEEPDANDPVVDESTVEGTPLEEAPDDDAPIEDVLGEESLAEERPAEEQPAEDEAGTQGDPAELASAESPLTALDAGPEPRESEATADDQGPADDDPSPTWSEEEWPPVAPPLTKDDAADSHPDLMSDTGPEAPVEAESADPETAGPQGTESDSDPADLWPLAEGDAPATEILHRADPEPGDQPADEPDEPTVRAEPPAPRADRPPPPPPLSGSRLEQPEVTEDLEQEWTEGGAEEEPRGFFDLYADAAADQTDGGDVTGSHGRHSSGDSGDEQSSDESKD